MPRIASTHVEVYLFRRRGRAAQFLVLRRAPGRKLAGVWQPVTGKLRRGERALGAAVREVREETGLDPVRWWVLESMTVYFDAVADAVVLLPLFAAELAPRAVIALSKEHDRAEFVSAREASRRFLWDAQRRGLRAVQQEVLRGGALAAALEIGSRTRSR